MEFVQSFLLRKSFIEASRLQLYYIRQFNCAKHNITRHQLNITSKQYNSPKANIVEKAGLDPTVLYFLCGENTAVGSAALTVHRTVIHYRLTLRLIRPRAHNPELYTISNSAFRTRTNPSHQRAWGLFGCFELNDTN